MLKIVEKKKIWFSISAAIILIGIGFMIFRGLNFGIDFTGGTRILLSYGDGFEKADADKVIKEYMGNNAITNTVGDDQYEIKTSKLEKDAL